ncbi:MAG: hypothetical protein ACQEV6_01920 [Pseudomonadota bacterium]
MKFPKATVILVSAALIFVAWDVTREKPDPGDTTRFTNLAEKPVERGAVVDWVLSRIPELCEDTTGEPQGSPAHSECVERSESRNSLCQRAIYSNFPEVIRSEAVFRDVTLTMMDCLVQ